MYNPNIFNKVFDKDTPDSWHWQQTTLAKNLNQLYQIQKNLQVLTTSLSS